MKYSNFIGFRKRLVTLLTFLLFCCNFSIAQNLIINEGSNRNYATIADEDQEFPDWIELYNAGTQAINLFNYALSDDALDPEKWQFPNIEIQPGEYKIIFCSGKDRKPITGFTNVVNESNYIATTGWNTHHFTEPFYWDGVSNIMINTCSYSGVGYTTNSVFNQTETHFYSTIFALQDESDAICSTEFGTKIKQRPNMKINDVVVGSGTIQNSNTSYPAPYGNWYWAARNQMLILASELTDAGLVEGNIDNLSFDVAETDPNTLYDYIDFHFKLVSESDLSSAFQNISANNFLHTNFKLKTTGETVYLYSPTQTLVSSLFVNCTNLDNSTGALPDASTNVTLFNDATPAASNNLSQGFSEYLLAPTFSKASGQYLPTQNINISNPNGANTSIFYTIDGSEPTTSSALYSGTIAIINSTVLRARAFSNSNVALPSPIAVASYLINIDHTTPILSVITENSNLYGEAGIFDNWWMDWERPAYVEYFDSLKQLIFSQPAGIQIDGGAGGSRSNPQHSFRVELDDAVLGAGPIDYALIPNRSYRNKYSKFYLRNGSNQYLVFPYKDASQVEMMAGETDNYYSAWRPITVYINGEYFGLYELREKFDIEYFEEIDDANEDDLDILSQSYWYGGVLRNVEGSVDSFYAAYDAFNSLNPADSDFWNQADRYFDMVYYNDYIIAESWMGNVDWPWNNIKIYRSDKTDYRWRFCLIDLELSMAPNGWTDAYSNHIQYMQDQNGDIPYINIWLKGMQNARFRNYFINRFADIMNTSYQFNRLRDIENSMFSQTRPEMANEYARWGNPDDIQNQLAGFNANHIIFQDQLFKRTKEVRNHIESNFNLESQVDITLKVMPSDAGKIQMNTIIPEALPWTGVYFNGNPVTLSVIPNPGFEFAYWEANNIISTRDTNNAIHLNVFEDATFTAVFNVNATVGKLAISEFNYHSDSTRDAGDWIEFYNYGDADLDISGYAFKDGNELNEFTFPPNTILSPEEYLVLVNDSVMFRSQHPDVVIFDEFDFNLSNSGEALSVLDVSNTLVLSINYFDSIPWPPAADGFGQTLELYDYALDESLPTSWFAGCIGGSPGGPYVPCSETITFSEINYNSSDDLDAGDWVELFNSGTTSKNISGWKFTDSDPTQIFTIPSGTILPPGSYLVLYRDADKFDDRFPDVTNKRGPFTFGLSGDGEGIRLYDATGKLYQSMVYQTENPWPAGANGNGYTLEIIDPNGILCDGRNWRIGCLEGSPGRATDPGCIVTNIEESLADIQFQLFPNPSSGKFVIDFEGLESNNQPLEISVFNLLGHSFYGTIIPNQQRFLEIDVSNVSAGIYFVNVKNGDKTYTKRILISR